MRIGMVLLGSLVLLITGDWLVRRVRYSYRDPLAVRVGEWFVDKLIDVSDWFMLTPFVRFVQRWWHFMYFVPNVILWAALALLVASTPASSFLDTTVNHPAQVKFELVLLLAVASAASALMLYVLEREKRHQEVGCSHNSYAPPWP